MCTEDDRNNLKTEKQKIQTSSENPTESEEDCQWDQLQLSNDASLNLDHYALTFFLLSP